MMDTTIRKSVEKQIIDRNGHDLLFEKYLRVIRDLVERYPVQRVPAFGDLVNFKKNKSIPIHRWFDYKQGYSEELVAQLMSSESKSTGYILDPFNGVGTTQVVAKDLGVKSIGIDINPVANFVARVKIHDYSLPEQEKIRELLHGIRSRYVFSTRVPKYAKLQEIFTPDQLRQVLSIKGFYESVADDVVKNFFKLAYLAIIEDCSNRIKDGNGIKIASAKKVISDVYGYFEKQCALMLEDIVTHNNHGEAVVLDGSILQDEVFSRLQDYSIDSAIFSPPYANCFDYCEVYKMEIWLGDFVDDYKDFARYRELALRSHVNSKFSNHIRYSDAKVQAISSLISTYNIWNKHIPDMILGYFDDMREVLRRIYALMRDGGSCSIVVANSGYKGIIVPTDLLLASIGEEVGFGVEKIIFAREIRASSQQIQELRSQFGLMRESVIILRK